ncbi:hypothetical protein PTRG_10438 [Pyrenophora tritici-repentis Pt-1C-BFP]|uniref:Uncharacterized protein n=1 Tax=Pyrenophora tritici-repentis (strain Pt-1C-BFP) TaxID=426418 RepID=B2WKC8_PYRTR|nr:uncharacterized protein PTRG_10438 [Pyrenophora tritici-repentis Pt-1C-BFP]EDU43488.1 hypothetical protein PTRG_10438 [Pyrenophora tritici-repentis Pt-1C-BFP]
MKSTFFATAAFLIASARRNSGPSLAALPVVCHTTSRAATL